MTIAALYNIASGLAQGYDGSETAYRQFMEAAIAYDDAGGPRDKVNGLLGDATRAITNVNREEDFLDRLERGGAKIFRHGAVFVRPDHDTSGVVNGDGEYTQAEHEPRLREVVMALQDRGIYFDDLVVDVGRVADTQMRKHPYMIVTIPRLNAQIAVADQKGEALFVANPAIPFMNWALFEKKRAGEEGGPFENVTRIVHSGAWEQKMLGVLLGDNPQAGPKVELSGYAKAHRKSKYPLTEEMVVAMSRLYRERHPEKKWPTHTSGPIDPEIVREVTGDPHWQAETWVAINGAGRQNSRGLTRTLWQTLGAHGCHYNLTEEMVVAMARLYRERHPDKKWPTGTSGAIDPEIVREVTGDPHWQAETWMAINAAGHRNNRGLSRSLPQMLGAHGCHYNLTEEMVVAMSRLYRERHPEKQWPANASGVIDPEIVCEVTGDPHWQAETWAAINGAGQGNIRGLKRTLWQTLGAHGCHYNLTEEMVVAMSRLYRERHPEKKWPTGTSGAIDPEIVREVTGDPHWQAETWTAIHVAGQQDSRGLTRSLSQILDAHCPERGKVHGPVAPMPPLPLSPQPF